MTALFPVLLPPLLPLLQALLLAAAALLAGLGFAAVRVGLPRRLLLLARWDGRVERMLELAERLHGEATLFHLARPLYWTSLLDWNARRTRDAVDRLAACWHQLGLREGDRLGIYKAGEFDSFLFSLAALRLGATAVPIPLAVAGDVAARHLERLDVRLLVTDGEGCRRLQGQGGPPPRGLQTVVLSDAAAPLAWRTGGVKRVRLAELLNQALPAVPAGPRGGRHPLCIVPACAAAGAPGDVTWHAAGLAQALRSLVLCSPVSRADLGCLALPLPHPMSLLVLHGALLLGLPCIVNADLGAPALIDQIERRRPTVFFGFPVTYTRLVAAGALQRPLDSVRLWVSTGDASHEVQQRAFAARGSFFRRLGLPVRGSLFADVLGPGEVGTLALLRVITPWTRRFGRRVGRKAPLGPGIRIADAGGRPVARGQAGRLMVRAGQGVRDAGDGWQFTGDLVRQGDDGELVHLDREEDVMHTASGACPTLPIEEVVLRHPAVLDTCVFGVRPAAGGPEHPAAVVALHDNVVPIAPVVLQRGLNARLDAPQRLAYLWVLPWNEFPLGPTGRPLKRTLREHYSARLQAPAKPRSTPLSTPLQGLA
jgi:long-chain acyl-CoA synthetase